MVAPHRKVVEAPDGSGNEGHHELENLQRGHIFFPPRWFPDAGQVIVVVHEAMHERVEDNSVGHPLDLTSEPHPTGEGNHEVVPEMQRPNFLPFQDEEGSVGILRILGDVVGPQAVAEAGGDHGASGRAVGPLQRAGAGKAEVERGQEDAGRHSHDKYVVALDHGGIYPSRALLAALEVRPQADDHRHVAAHGGQGPEDVLADAEGGLDI
mmetsp:Transcript_66684/g.168981  ORF Transcript_66684/g.168981 Transcript_66684/m.168981 type:complete len:210 (+) Transcript_66684:340-969(+)